LLGQLDRILRILDSEAGLKEKKSGGVVAEEGECGVTVLFEMVPQYWVYFTFKHYFKWL